MNIFLWIVLIHVCELILVLGYLLIRKNRKLEQVVLEQQQYIDIFSKVIETSNERLKELDSRGVFSSDDEIGWFFEQIQEIQRNLNDFNIKK